jgi:hypothetical protein
MNTDETLQRITESRSPALGQNDWHSGNRKREPPVSRYDDDDETVRAGGSQARSL